MIHIRNDELRKLDLDIRTYWVLTARFFHLLSCDCESVFLTVYENSKLTIGYVIKLPTGDITTTIGRAIPLVD